MNKCVFVLTAQGWTGAGGFSQSQCISPSVPVQFFLPMDSCTSQHCCDNIKRLHVCQLLWERHLRPSGMDTGSEVEKEMKQMGGRQTEKY